MKSSKNPKGFTLIELLVVIAVLTILLSIMLPSMRRTKYLAKKVVCMNNIGVVIKSSTAYAISNGSKFPYHNARLPSMVKFPNETHFRDALYNGGFMTQGKCTICPVVAQDHINDHFRDANAYSSTNQSYGGWNTDAPAITLSYFYFMGWGKGRQIKYYNNEQPWPVNMFSCDSSAVAITHRVAKDYSRGHLIDEGHFGLGKIKGGISMPLETSDNPLGRMDGSVDYRMNSQILTRAIVKDGYSFMSYHY